MTARKPPGARTSVAPAMASGDRRKSLIALRDQLAERLDATSSARDAATMARQLAAIVSELDGLGPARGWSKRDELRAKRAARLAAGRAAAESGSDAS